MVRGLAMLNKKALAASVSAPPAPFVEDVFSTYLYTGNGSTQTITNGIDLAGEGGLVWIKDRGTSDSFHRLQTAEGSGYRTHYSNSTSAGSTLTSSQFSFNSNGFLLNIGGGDFNALGNNFASWTFRKQPKFFDVVTWTGNGANNRQISHNLGSAPGCIILKRTDGTGDWWTYHRSLGDDGNGFSYDLRLNSTSSRAAYQIFGAGATQTSTYFTLGTVFANEMNGSGATYVAYLFAHDAGGFGEAGTDNVISCGSLTATSGIVSVNLGYEPQYVMVKRSSGSQSWYVGDVMREMSQTNYLGLIPNTSAAEGAFDMASVIPTATGFNFNTSAFGAGTYIYMAIRRPMKVPTTGTEVFSPNTLTPSGATTVTTGFPVDLTISGVRNRGGSITGTYVTDRLRGDSTNQFTWLFTNATDAEGSATGYGFGMDNNTATIDNVYNTAAAITTPCIYWNFRRASGFFDEVCYTGTGSATTFNHNLGVVPELMITKCRNKTGTWWTYHSALGATQALQLESNTTPTTSTNIYNDTSPTSTVFTVGITSSINGSNDTFVAYLFATLAGVSKVGSYTGNGTTQAIACGFTGGARFVLIKRTDSTGDWYVYDTTRGMTLLTDPYLRLNSTAAEVATLGSVTTTTGGFTVNASILAAINTSGASYIFLAIA
jgi:hypothetical protein